jgi:hypothetical protein
VTQLWAFDVDAKVAPTANAQITIELETRLFTKASYRHPRRELSPDCNNLDARRTVAVQFSSSVTAPRAAQTLVYQQQLVKRSAGLCRSACLIVFPADDVYRIRSGSIKDRVSKLLSRIREIGEESQ